MGEESSLVGEAGRRGGCRWRDVRVSDSALSVVVSSRVVVVEGVGGGREERREEEERTRGRRRKDGVCSVSATWLGWVGGAGRDARERRLHGGPTLTPYRASEEIIGAGHQRRKLTPAGAGESMSWLG